MAERYCPRCGTDVTDVGGFCLLGHPLKLTSMTETHTLADLRAEVDQAFDDVATEVAQTLGQIEESVPVDTAGSEVLEDPEVAVTSYENLWQAFEDEALQGPDPITAFAPPPRMDWGPERSRRRRDRGGFETPELA